MSVWKRFQRVGKKAAKYQYTASYTELLIETNNFKPSKLVITWLRRNRKYPSEQITLLEIPSKPYCYNYVWEVPRNEEIQTTLYKMKKDLEFEEKDWTFQLEDVGNSGTQRRLLAYRNINISQYAEATPTQNNIKISFKISSKKVKSATLFLTLSAVFLREGDATDEDMISVASLMSLPSSQNYVSAQLNDVAVLSDLDDMENGSGTEAEPTISDKINELCDQIGSLDWDMDKTTDSIRESEDASSKYSVVEDSISNKSHSLVKPINIQVEYDDDTLFSIAEDDISINSEPNSTSDLLDWCQLITGRYKDVKVTNFTTSFRNGIAFCVIIHYFHPHLIDFESLKPSNVKENNRIAFTAAASLGIPKVLDPNEMSFLKVPDSLSVMTYLHQLRTHFTDNNLVITPASIGHNNASNYSKQTSLSISPSPTESKNFNNIMVFPVNEPHSHVSLSLSSAPEIKSPMPVPSIIESIADLSSINDSQIKRPNESETRKFPEEPALVKPMKIKSPKKPKKMLSSFNIDGSVKDNWSLSEKKIKPVTLDTLNMFTEHDLKENHAKTSPKSLQTNGHAVSPLFPKKLTLSPVNKTHENYITAETEALEREQDKIDEQASQLERQIRLVMGKDKKSESILMEKWFHIVNKKNALIRRNMQLQILEKEQNLECKWNLLQEELRQIISIEEWSKTDEMKRREDLLMKDLVNIINQRDKVVKELDEYEQGIATDIEWACTHQEVMGSRSIFHKTLASAKFSDKNCIIQ